MDAAAKAAMLISLGHLRAKVAGPILAEAAKAQLEIEPLAAHDIDKLLADAYAAPQTIVQQAAELVEPPGQK